MKGSLKYSDEIVDAVKPAIKNSDEIADGVKGVLKSDIADNVDDIGKAVGKNIYEVNENIIKNNNRTRLPRKNGNWKGEPGNGEWFSNNPEVIKITNGEGISFINGRPDFSKWKKGSIIFKNGVLNGSNDDFNAVYDKIKQIKEFQNRQQAKNWLREKELTPHHKSSTEIELIPTKLHNNIPHIGSASDLRGGK